VVVTASSSRPGEYLAHLRAERGLSQDDLARRLDVTRTTVSQWENGHRRPSPHHLDTLVDVLADEGRLIALFTRHDGDEAPLLEAPMTATALIHETVDGLLAHLSSGEAIDGQPGYGWGHDLDTATPITALSTAYGLKAILVAGRRDWRVSLPRIRETLERLELPTKGWSVGRWAGEALPEVTAVVVSALHDAGASEDYVEERAALVINRLGRGLETPETARPYVLATSLFELSRLKVDEHAARSLVEALIDLRLGEGGGTWPVRQKEAAALTPAAPSPVHTAIAVCALTAWGRRLADDQIVGVAEAGASWLETVQHMPLEDETLPGGDADVHLRVREFTPAWIVRALVSARRSSDSDAIRRAFREMFPYRLPGVGLWHWPTGGGIVPAWMAYNAIAALVAWAGAHEVD
jgi:transcriptional regulator with XRE-family HTH domain